MSRFSLSLMLVSIQSLAGSQAAEAQQNRWTFGMNVSPTRMPGDSALRIVSIWSGSAAQQSGLQVGQVISAVNGQQQEMSQAQGDFEAIQVMQRGMDASSGMVALTVNLNSA